MMQVSPCYSIFYIYYKLHTLFTKLLIILYIIYPTSHGTSHMYRVSEKMSRHTWYVNDNSIYAHLHRLPHVGLLHFLLVLNLRGM